MFKFLKVLPTLIMLLSAGCIVYEVGYQHDMIALSVILAVTYCFSIWTFSKVSFLYYRLEEPGALTKYMDRNHQSKIDLIDRLISDKQK